MKNLKFIGLINLVVVTILFSRYHDPLEVFLIGESLFLIYLR